MGMKQNITEKAAGCCGISDAKAALEDVAAGVFLKELIELSRKHGLVLVPQDEEYHVSFLNPMRVVPMTDEIEKEIRESWVCFEEKL